VARRRDRANHRERGSTERDVDRISGRVRLMVRDVEVSQPEREVDRVDVFEGGGEKGEVDRDVDSSERDDWARNPEP